MATAGRTSTIILTTTAALMSFLQVTHAIHDAPVQSSEIFPSSSRTRYPSLCLIHMFPLYLPIARYLCRLESSRNSLLGSPADLTSRTNVWEGVSDNKPTGRSSYSMKDSSYALKVHTSAKETNRSIICSSAKVIWPVPPWCPASKNLPKH